MRDSLSVGCRLPPGIDLAGAISELSAVPDSRRDDAVQEAWVAHLEGRDPVRAIAAYARRERRHSSRESTMAPASIESAEAAGNVYRRVIPARRRALHTA